jgi:ElaB/YqjD/DUF883 family membrane-anchored ribosome-binding protein
MNTTRDLVSRPDFRARIDEVHRVVRERASLLKGNAQSSMRTQPEKWIGIAAASGFILGLLGRLMQLRSERHRHQPQLIVIETM